MDDQYTYPSYFCVNANIKCNVFDWYGIVFVLLLPRCSLSLVESGHGWHLVGSYTVNHKDIGFLCGTNKESEERALIARGREGEREGKSDGGKERGGREGRRRERGGREGGRKEGGRIEKS